MKATKLSKNVLKKKIENLKDFSSVTIKGNLFQLVFYFWWRSTMACEQYRNAEYLCT